MTNIELAEFELSKQLLAGEDPETICKWAHQKFVELYNDGVSGAQEAIWLKRSKLEAESHSDDRLPE
jgi:hypothetical protein